MNANPNTPEKKVVKFQHYNSARQSIQTITNKGKKIAFIGHEFITKDKDIITWLNAQIEEDGLPGITMGELLSSEESDPMAGLKKRIIAEYLADEIKENAAVAKGVIKSMGNTKPEDAAKLGAASTKQIATA